MHEGTERFTERPGEGVGTLAIIGLGLMGGSLGLAAKRLGAAKCVKASARRDLTRKLAIANGVADEVFENPADAVKDADVVVVCTPVKTIPDLVRSLADSLKPTAAVTDVGSTKGELVSELEAICPGYVGSHPMAGSEREGIEAARADLYVGSTAVLTPTDASAKKCVQKIDALWKGVGAHTCRMTPSAHDELITKTSHLPHLVAAILTAVAAKSDNEDAGALCGGGFRDTTRIASGSPVMWRDIVATNAENILAELKVFTDIAAHLTDLIEKEDFEALQAFLEDAQSARQNLLK